MRWKIVLLFVMLIACSEKPTAEDLPLINGYWEIQKVIFPDGASKEYKVSTTIDYIYYEAEQGYRKKVQPNLDGGFSTSDDAAYFKIELKMDTFILQYKNELSQWEERIGKLEEESMVLISEEGIAYHYKKFYGITAK